MKEDFNCRLALRLNQVKILLAAQTIIHIFDKQLNRRMHSQFEQIQRFCQLKLVNQGTTSKTQQFQNQYCTPQTKKKSVKFQPKCTPAACLLFKNIILKHISKYFLAIKNERNKKNTLAIKLLLSFLEKTISKNKRMAMVKMMRFQQIAKGLRKIEIVHNFNKQKLLYRSLFQLVFIVERQIHSKNYSELSLHLDWQNCLQYQSNQNQENQLAVQKELLATKFASSSLILRILHDSITKIQFSFLLSLRAHQQKDTQLHKRNKFQLTHSPGEQSEEDKIKPKIIAINQIFNILLSKVKQPFQELTSYYPRPSTVSLKFYKPKGSIMDSIHISGHKKLQAFVQRIFKDDDQQKKTITTNSKNVSNTLVPSVRLVSQFSNTTKNNYFSDSDATINSNSANTIDNLPSMKSSPVANFQFIKKKRLSKTIDTFLSSAAAPKLQEQNQIQVPPTQQTKKIIPQHLLLSTLGIIVGILFGLMFTFK